MTEPILEVKDLSTYFYTDEGIVRAVEGVSFRVDPGQTLGIVGESGSGKSVTAKSIIRLLEEPSRIVGLCGAARLVTRWGHSGRERVWVF